MRKKLLYIIFFIVLCFVVYIGESKAADLNYVDCYYEIRSLTRRSYSQSTNESKEFGNELLYQLWIKFDKKDTSSEWQVRLNSNGEQDIWYKREKDESRIHLKDYKVDEFNGVCPSTVILNTGAKTITFSDNTYTLYKYFEIYADEESTESGRNEFHCEYGKLKVNAQHNYYIYFSDSGNGSFSFYTMYQYSKADGTGGVGNDKYNMNLVTAREDSYGQLCPTKLKNNNGKLELGNSTTLYLRDQNKRDNVKICKYDRSYTVEYSNNISLKIGRDEEEYDGNKELYLDYKGADCPAAIKVTNSTISVAEELYFDFKNTDSTTEFQYCYELMDKDSCIKNTDSYSCLWIEDESLTNGGYCNPDNLQFVACGDAYDIPGFIPNLTSLLVTLLKTVAPIILIFVSIISLLKAVAASKEDEIKKAQKSLIRKIIAAAMVFLIISIVQFVIGKIADTKEADHIESCFDCLLNKDCKTNTYYKYSINGQNYCRNLEGNLLDKCPEDSLTK